MTAFRYSWRPGLASSSSLVLLVLKCRPLLAIKEKYILDNAKGCSG